MPTQAGSAAAALQVALVTALEADALVVGPPSVGIYSGAAPEGTTGDYIVVSDVAEGSFALFANLGSRLVVTLNLWSVGVGTMRTLALYAAVRRVLDRVTLPVAGHRLVTGSTNLITTLYDAAAGRRQGVVRYEVLTVGATP